MKTTKGIISFAVVLLMIISSTKYVYAGTYRFEGQNYYNGARSGYPSGHGNCAYGDRPVTQYFDKLEPCFCYSGYSMKGKWYNQSAWENDITYGQDRVDDANFFVFGGYSVHTLKPTCV